MGAAGAIINNKWPPSCSLSRSHTINYNLKSKEKKPEKIIIIIITIKKLTSASATTFLQKNFWLYFNEFFAVTATAVVIRSNAKILFAHNFAYEKKRNTIG